MTKVFCAKVFGSFPLWWGICLKELEGMKVVLMFLDNINNLLSVILIPLLIFAGIYFTFKTRFAQFRLFKNSFSALLYKPKNKDGKKGSSPFRSLMISMASRIGVGQIAGIASAISIGGPGSVFWMWIIAILGSTSAFIESTLAQIYKVKDKESSGFRGGPAYYITKALGKRGLAVLYTVLLICAYAYGFNMLQAFQLISSFSYYIPGFEESSFPLIIGLILSLITALVIFGGNKNVSFISAYVVPFMSVAYIILALTVTFKNFGKIPSVFKMILDDAFSIRAIATAPFSMAYLSPLIHGIKRGLFSNEAGMGSSPNSAATADVPHPVVQGLVQLISVFIDTFLICTSTALIVLLSGVDFRQKISQISLVQNAVKSQVGDFGVHIVIFAILSFAFTSIIGNYSYAETNVLYIKNNKKVLNIFRVTCVSVVFVGSLVGSTVAWATADLFMSLMAILNILVILKIGKTAILVLKDYVKKIRKNKNIGDLEFKAEELKIKNTECW